MYVKVVLIPVGIFTLYCCKIPQVRAVPQIKTDSNWPNKTAFTNFLDLS